MRPMDKEEDRAWIEMSKDLHRFLDMDENVADSIASDLIDQGWRKRIPKATQLVREAEEQRARADAAEARASEAEADAERLWDLLARVRRGLADIAEDIRSEPEPVVSKGPAFVTFEGQSTGTTWNTSRSYSDQVANPPMPVGKVTPKYTVGRTESYFRDLGFPDSGIFRLTDTGMPPVQETPGLCNNNGGQGIGAGHVCMCNMKPGHDGRHGCSCGATWL